MGMFETVRIYRVNPKDSCLYPRYGEISVVDERIKNFTLPFWVQGIERYDLAVFGVVLDDNGVSEEGLLVISSSQNRGLLARPELIEESPNLQTPELTKKFATLKDEELVQLSIDSLVKCMRQRYQGMRGFMR